MEGVEGQGIHTGKESKMQFKYIQDKSKGFSLKKKKLDQMLRKNI